MALESNMKAAVILGGGRGTRLQGVAGLYAKTMLEVNHLPVIAYAVKAVVPYVDQIVVVAHPSTAKAVYAAALRGLDNQDVTTLLALQPEPLGMADAIRIGLETLEKDMPAVVMCGDNIVLDGRNVKNVLEYVTNGADDRGASGLAWTYREINNEEARRFSVYQSLGLRSGKLIEKPDVPPSNICWCGPIAFKSALDARQRVRRLTPSDRGEYEASDLMNSYLQAGEAERVALIGPWFDVGTPDSLAEARQYMLTEV